MNGKTYEQTETTIKTEYVAAGHAEMAHFDVEEYLAQGTTTGERERIAEENKQLLAKIEKLETKLKYTERKLKTAEERVITAEKRATTAEERVFTSKERAATAEHALASSKSANERLKLEIEHVTRGLRLVAGKYNRVVDSCQRFGVTTTTTMEQLIAILRQGGNRGQESAGQTATLRRELKSLRKESHRLEKELEIERGRPPPYDPTPLLKENSDLRVQCEQVMGKFKTLVAFVASCKVDSENGSAELKAQLQAAHGELEVVQKRLGEVRAATDLAVAGAVSVSNKLAMNMRHECRYTTMDFDSAVEISAEIETE